MKNLSLCIAMFLTSNLYALDVKTDKGVFPHGMADGGVTAVMTHDILYTTSEVKQPHAINFFTEDKKCIISGIAQYNFLRTDVKLKELLCFQSGGISIDGYVVSLEDNMNGLKVEEPTVTNDDFKAEVKMQKIKAVYSFVIK